LLKQAFGPRFVTGHVPVGCSYFAPTTNFRPASLKLLGLILQK